MKLEMGIREGEVCIATFNGYCRDCECLWCAGARAFNPSTWGQRQAHFFVLKTSLVYKLSSRPDSMEL